MKGLAVTLSPDRDWVNGTIGLTVAQLGHSMLEENKTSDAECV